MTVAPPEEAEADECLAARLKVGDPAALAEFSLRWRDRLYRLALLYCGHPEDALDLVQDIHLEVWRSISGYAAGTRFEAWLMRLAANRALSWRRRRRVRLHQPLDAYEAPSPGPGPEGEALSAERAARVREALAGLPERERLLLVLRTLEGWSPGQIGEALGMKPASVSVALSRARAAFRDRCLALGLDPGNSR